MKNKQYINYVKTKREKIFELLDQCGYISDSQAVKIYGNEDGIYKINEHIRIWKKLRSDENFFSDKKIIEKKKGYRSHLVRIQGQQEGQYYKVGKEFFNLITPSTA